MRINYKRKKDVKFINPYTFVPVSKKEPVTRSALEAPESGRLHTGVLRCRLYVRTPLGIPDAEREKAGMDGHKEYPFFSYTENGKTIPVIPGSSLRGSIRSVFETATDSCFPTLREDTGLSRRVDNRKAYKPGILKWEKGGWHLYQAERYLLAVKPEEDDRKRNYTEYGELPPDAYVHMIRREDGRRAAMTREKEELRFGDLVDFQPYTQGKGAYTKNNFPVWKGVARNVRKKREGIAHPADRKDGLVYIGETFAKKKHGESVFVMGEEVKALTQGQVKKAYEGLLESLEIYRNPAVNRSKGHSGYKDFEYAKKERGIPVWYSEEDKKLSLASIGRTFYNTSLNELAGERKPCINRKKLCEACTLFGMAGEESLGSRVRITDARAQEGYRLKWETLKILGQPRYSYLPFYARSVSGIPDSYDDPKVEIAGRKFYWHNREAAKDSRLYAEREKNQMNNTLELVMPGAEFCFDIYYDGITQEQLQKLMWCIHFGENKKDGNLCCKLGHGKPLGLGSVKIVIEEKKERIFEEGVYRWELEMLPEEGTEPELKNNKELKRVMDFREPGEKIPIKYPYICDEYGKDLSDSRRNENARHVWYLKNKEVRREKGDPSEPLPGIMAKDQALHPYQKMQGNSQYNNHGSNGFKRR